MGFQVDLKEFLEVLAKLQKDTGKTNEQLEKAKNALNGIIQADAMQGATGKAIVNDINNNQKTVVTGLELANKFLIMEMAQTLQDFQSTTGETDENAVILEDALLQAQNKLSNLQPKKHELDSRISNIYNSVSDLISLSMPNSQFDEKLVAASKELEDTIQKVQQFESKKEKSNAEDILNTLNKQVQMAKEMSSLSYTNPQLQAFFAQDALAKGIHEMDTQITKAEKEAKLQAEREMKKKQEEWADNHPVEAWLQNFSKSAGEKWDVLRKGTKWVGENIPFLKGLSDDLLVLEGFLGAAGSAISGIAIGATKLGSLVLELGEWGFNSIRGVETEQWKLDDIYGAGNTIKSLGQAIISWQDYPKYGKALFNSVKGYVEKALTDPYALGGAIFDIGSCFVGVGEVNAAVKGTAAFGKLVEGRKVFQVAAKSDKIGGKLEEITALRNKLPSSMKNALEKFKNIEIPSLFPQTSLAGVGGVEERKTLGALFSGVKSETKGTEKVLKGKEIYGPYYEEAMELYRKNPEWYPNPDESFIVQGKELRLMRDEYSSLVKSGILEKGHHIQGLAFGGKNVGENIKFTGESTIKRTQLKGVDLDFYHQKEYGKKGAKVLKIYETSKDSGIFRFGLNPQHTEITNFQNKVLRWQRQNGLRE